MLGSVQSLSHVWFFANPWTAARQAFLSTTNSQSLPKLMSIESVMPSNYLILCRPLLLLPPIPPSIRVFSNESALCIRWPYYWSFSFSVSLSNEHPGLISFRMDWLDLLAVQGTPKSLLQHHSSKASILLGGTLDSVVLKGAQVVLTQPWLMISCHTFRCLSRWVGHVNQKGQGWGWRQTAKDTTYWAPAPGELVDANVVSSRLLFY